VLEIARRDENTFSSIISSLEQGIKSLDLSISSQSASAIDNLVAYYFKHQPRGEKPNEAGAALEKHLSSYPDALPRLLTTLFEVVLFEDCSNQWSLSRPMLTLILVTESVYPQIRQQIIANQPVERQESVGRCLDHLMVDVSRTLDAKNRDKFTQNLTVARHELRSKS
jgi:exportin-7